MLEQYKIIYPMKAHDLYQKYGNSNPIPHNQIAFHEWHQKYVMWLESQVEELYNDHIHKLK